MSKNKLKKSTKQILVIASILTVVSLMLLIAKTTSLLSSSDKPDFVLAGSVKGTPSIVLDDQATIGTIESVDYATCSPGSHSVSLPLGSNSYVFIGKQKDKCILYMGGEIENPRWDGRLYERCEIPTSLGTTTNGLGDISQYCVDNR